MCWPGTSLKFCLHSSQPAVRPLHAYALYVAKYLWTKCIMCAPLSPCQSPCLFVTPCLSHHATCLHHLKSSWGASAELIVQADSTYSAYFEARDALHGNDPAAAQAVDAVLSNAGQRMARRQQAMTDCSVFTEAQNAVRARTQARVQLHKGLSQPSLMLATNPTKALERSLPEGAVLAAMQNLAGNLAQAAPRRRSTTQLGDAPLPPTPGMPSNRALVGGSAHNTFLRRTMTAKAAKLAASGGGIQHGRSLSVMPSAAVASRRRGRPSGAVNPVALAERQRMRIQLYERAVADQLTHGVHSAAAEPHHGTTSGGTDPTRPLRAVLSEMHRQVLADVRHAQLVAAVCEVDDSPATATAPVADSGVCVSCLCSMCVHCAVCEAWIMFGSSVGADTAGKVQHLAVRSLHFELADSIDFKASVSCMAPTVIPCVATCWLCHSCSNRSFSIAVQLMVAEADLPGACRAGITGATPARHAPQQSAATSSTRSRSSSKSLPVRAISAAAARTLTLGECASSRHYASPRTCHGSAC